MGGEHFDLAAMGSRISIRKIEVDRELFPACGLQKFGRKPKLTDHQKRQAIRRHERLLAATTSATA
jgi:hypothetical protein